MRLTRHSPARSSGFEDLNEAQQAYALRQYLKEIGPEGIQAAGLRIQHYFTDSDRAAHLVQINLSRLYLNGVPMNTIGINGEPLNQAMYAMDVNGVLYAKCYDKTSQTQINHSSFTAGQNVLCAGTMRVMQGRLTDLTPASGHYMPDLVDLLECMRQMEMHGYRPDQVSHVTTFWDPNTHGRPVPGIQEGPTQLRVPWGQFKLWGGGFSRTNAANFAGTWSHAGTFLYLNLAKARLLGCNGPIGQATPK